MVHWFARGIRPYMRHWDVKSSKNVDDYFSNSRNIQRQVKWIYGRDSQVLDIDERTQGGASDFSDGLVITYNGGINVIGTPALYSLGPNVIVGDEGFGEFEGLAHGDGEASPGGSTDGNIAFDFGGVAVTSLSFRYFSTDDAPANPSGQLMGISDLSWIVPEPGTGVLVWAGLLLLGICQRRV